MTLAIQHCETRNIGTNYAKGTENWNSPRNKNNLVPQSLPLLLKLEIIDSPSTVFLGQILQKLIVVLFLRCFENYDFFEVFAKAKDDVLDLLLELQYLKFFQA